MYVHIDVDMNVNTIGHMNVPINVHTTVHIDVDMNFYQNGCNMNILKKMFRNIYIIIRTTIYNNIKMKGMAIYINIHISVHV